MGSRSYWGLGRGNGILEGVKGLRRGLGSQWVRVLEGSWRVSEGWGLERVSEYWG